MTLPNNSDGPQAGIPSWARVGAKVVCIAGAAMIAAAAAKRPWGKFPFAGGVYAIRGIVTGTDGVANLLLVGVENPPMESTVGLVEWGFPSRYFRPLVTLEDDITTYFAELLDVPAGQKVEA